MSQPYESRTAPPDRFNPYRFNPGAALAGVIFVVLGTLFLLDALDALNLRRDIVWPVVIILLGVAVMLSALWRGGRS